MAVLIGTIGVTALTLSAFKSGPGRQQSSVRADDTSRPRSSEQGRDLGGTNDPRKSGKVAVSRKSCSDARAGRAYYLIVAEHWAHKMGAVFRRSHEHARNCVRQRELAATAHRKAHVYRQRYRAWVKAQADEWNWRAWLPDKWRRIGTCETGLDWHWNSGTYQGAFGFYWGTWDAYKPRGYPDEAYQATPRQQMNVAINVRDGANGHPANGYGAWGCGGA